MVSKIRKSKLQIQAKFNLNISCIVENSPYICCRNHMTMASIAYLYNDRLDMVKYRDYLKASLELTKEEREAMILKRKHKTLIKRK